MRLPFSSSVRGYVLQEHNDRPSGKEVQADFAKNLSAIVETQKLIQTLQLDLEAAAKLVAERAQKITSASGAAIGIIEKGDLVYRAGTGSAAMDCGITSKARVIVLGRLPRPWQRGKLHRHQREPSSPRQTFQDREVKSFIAVPVYHAGQSPASLNCLRPGQCICEADLRTAELMAGFAQRSHGDRRAHEVEAMHWRRSGRACWRLWKRIKPQLERLGNRIFGQRCGGEAASSSLQSPATGAKAERAPATYARSAAVIFLTGQKRFCGICGSARTLCLRSH